MNTLLRIFPALAFAVTVVSAARAGAATPAVGAPAPAFELHSLDGRTLTKATFRGKTLVINVWASWCPPCRIEAADLIAESASRGGSVAFVGVDTTETPAIVRAFTASKGVTYDQVVTTTNSAFARNYDIRNYPTTFVIDPHGVLRAQHADNVLPRKQLAAYIDAAGHGRSVRLVSAEQRKLEALLDPAAFRLAGDPATVRAGARAAVAAIARADDEMDVTMSDPARDHDLIATHRREQVLRTAVLTALEPVATTRADRLLVARLYGDSAAASGDWRGAQRAYAAALTLNPRDRAALAGAAYAASRRGDNVAVARFALRSAAIDPSYVSETAVARSQAYLGRRAASDAAADRAIALAVAHGTAAQRAWTLLAAGRIALMLNDTPRARTQFAAASAAAARIPARDRRRVMYEEEAREAQLALASGDGARPRLSLAPWTGPLLPGSIAGTPKYRLALTGEAARSIDLRARGLPKGWIGSFCSDRLCAPFSTTVVVPRAGVKIVEFQVIPGDDVRRHPVVTIEASDNGKVLAAASTTVVP